VAITTERNYKTVADETTLIRDVSEDMLLLEPDQSPLLVLTTKNNRKAPTKSPKFEWVEDQEVNIWDTVASTVDYTAGVTSILVNDVTLYVIGDVLLFPVAATAAPTTEELALVTAVGTNAVTVTRGFAGTTAGTIGSTQSIRVLCSSIAEGAAVPTVRTTQKVVKTSYAPIFRTPVDISKTLQSTEAYGSPAGERKLQQIKALQRHKQEIESAGLWSAGSEAKAAAGSTWTTQGVRATIATYVTNVAGTFSLTIYNSFCQTAFRYGSSEKLLMAAPLMISALNYFSQNKLLTHVGDTVYGVKISRLLANGLGEFMLANNFRMGDGVSGKNNFGSEAYAIDLPSVRYRFLAGNGNSRDTKLFENVKQDGIDRTIDEYLTQAGWEVRFDKKHALLYNMTSYQ
jgi:hypothetical protein